MQKNPLMSSQVTADDMNTGRFLDKKMGIDAVFIRKSVGVARQPIYKTPLTHQWGLGRS
jgi:hypothetical protein